MEQLIEWWKGLNRAVKRAIKGKMNRAKKRAMKREMKRAMKNKEIWCVPLHGGAQDTLVLVTFSILLIKWWEVRALSTQQMTITKVFLKKTHTLMSYLNFIHIFTQFWIFCEFTSESWIHHFQHQKDGDKQYCAVLLPDTFLPNYLQYPTTASCQLYWDCSNTKLQSTVFDQYQEELAIDISFLKV